MLANLAGLEFFDAVARHLSFSRAARELHVTQGAVSHRVRQLEDELGVPLFLRTSRKVELTDEGRILFRATQEGLQAIRAGLRELEERGRGAQVVVSCSPSFAIRWLVPHLGVLHASSPELEVHIKVSDALVEPGLSSVDACVRFGPGGYSGSVVEQLSRDRAFPVCSPRYLEALALRAPADLARATLLHDDVLRDHPGHVGWTEWLATAGLDAIAPAAGPRFSHSHLALDAAAAGQGVAIGRETLVRADLRAGRLVAPFAPQVPSGLNYWLLTPRQSARGAAIAAFRDWLVARLAAEAGDEQNS